MSTIIHSSHDQVCSGNSGQSQDQWAGLTAPAAASSAVSSDLANSLKRPSFEQDNPFFPARLIIVAPPRNLDTLKLARLIGDVVHKHKSDLLFLSVVEDSQEESYAEEYMADLIELTSKLRVGVERKIICSENWIAVVKRVWQVGDVVICPAEQSITINGKCIPLGIALSQEPEIPALMFTGYYHEWTRNAKWWSVAVAILALSSYSQAGILRYIRGWPNLVMLCLSLLIEITLIWIWN